MLKLRLQRLWRAPKFPEEEQTLRAWVLHVILWSMLLVVDSQFPVTFLILPQYWPRWLASLLTLNMTVPLLLVLNRRGHTRLAGVLLVTVLWLIVTAMALTAGGIRAPAITAYVVDVLIAGLLFGAKGGVIAGIISCLLGLGFVLLEWTGHLPASRVRPTSLSLWVNLVYFVQLTVIFQSVANYSIKTAMAQAQRELQERERAEIALRQSHDELEARVRERTVELQKANKELEAFSYSVSHDLRRPVRTVIAFADVLLCDHAGEMSEEAQALLAEIKGSAVRMNQLIEDLLNLSRIDRQPLVRSPVNFTELVRDTIEELRAEQPERKMDIRVAELPEATGDPALLKQALVNLLSNAIKFSRDRPVALIEVGYKTEKSKTIYYVRDNGVGFDMQYADKLFGVFQRLHSVENFTGTGVGLSIVQRIIHRHGGRIWAESGVDQGATFYFTVPEAGQGPQNEG
jgi:signal transduction histidine kinase